MIAACEDPLNDLTVTVTRLGAAAGAYGAVDGSLFLSTADWTDKTLALLEDAMARCPRRLLIANAGLSAPRDTGFSREPGDFSHLLTDRFPDHLRFFGKPLPEVYSLVEAPLAHVARDRIVMCGDAQHTDIPGAAARG